MSQAWEYDSGMGRGLTAAAASIDARAAFIRRTYGHLAAAILAFVGIQAALFQSGLAAPVLQTLFGHQMAPLFLLAAFIGAGWLANYWAHSDVSPALQYAGLALYVVAQAIICLPLLFVAMIKTGDAALIYQAGFLTLAIFAGLTTAVLTTGKDFSFLGPILCVGGWLAFGFIIAGLVFGFGTGLFFSFALVALASGYIIYDTSNVIHHYRTDQHVAAALALFASVALLFFYVLRILIALQDRR
jgi:FtsH-binding integral membrane protein